jgi:polysaccharide biosynthesis transport protein
MATEGRTMPEWAQAAAVRQALRTKRDRLGGFGHVLWRRKVLILACLGLVLASTAAYVSALTPAYEAEARVARGDVPEQSIGSNGAGEDPTGLIETRAMAERLVERLGLQLLPEFHPDPSSRGLRRTALTALRQWLPAALVDRLANGSADPLATRPSERAVTDEERAARLRDAVIEATMTRIRAELTPSSAIGLKFISEDPQVAAAGANALADLYLEQRPPPPPATSRGEREKVEQEIGRLRGDVRATEQAIAAGRGGADAQASGTSERSRLELTGELAFWRRERAGVEARLRQAQAALGAGADLAKSAPDLNSERLDQLQRRAIELQKALAALSQQSDQQDPQIVDLRAQLAALEEERRVELEQILKELRDERGIIQSRETELEEKINARRDASTAGAAAGRLTALEQKLEADRALLRERLDQAAQLEGQPQARGGDARIIRPAVAPSQPAYPRLALIWGVAAVGSLALGVAVAFLLEALRHARA